MLNSIITIEKYIRASKIIGKKGYSNRIMFKYIIKILQLLPF